MSSGAKSEPVRIQSISHQQGRVFSCQPTRSTGGFLSGSSGGFIIAGQVPAGRGTQTHRPAVDHQEGFGGAVEGAGSQRVGPTRDDVAQVVVGARRPAEGELGEGLIGLILLVVQQVLQGV